MTSIAQASELVWGPTPGCNTSYAIMDSYFPLEDVAPSSWLRNILYGMPGLSSGLDTQLEELPLTLATTLWIMLSLWFPTQWPVK